MSILALDSAHLLDAAASFLLIAGTAISILAILLEGRRAWSVRPPPDDSAFTIFLVLAGTVGFLFLGTSVASLLLKGIHSEEFRTQLAGVIGMGVAISGAFLFNTLYRRDGFFKVGLSKAQFLPGISVGPIWLILVLPWVFLTNLGVEWILHRYHIDAPTMHDIFRVWQSPQGQSLSFRIVAIISPVVVAPVFEELLFRGLFQTLIRRLIATKTAHASDFRQSLGVVVITAAMFTSMHRPWPITPAIFVLAIGLGLAYERRGNLWTTITMHCLFNALNFAMFLFVKP